MSVITIPKALRDKLGDEATESFTLLLKEVEVEARKDSLVLAEERLEKRLIEENGKLRVEVKEDIANLRAEMKDEFSKVYIENEKIRTEMQKLKAEIIKWMFLFWIGQISVIALLFKFLK